MNIDCLAQTLFRRNASAPEIMRSDVIAARTISFRSAAGAQSLHKAGASVAGRFGDYSLVRNASHFG
jgi:hypothetical protein